MKNKFPILIFSIIFLMSFVLASFPGIPHQFYGNVFTGGVETLSGTITAEIMGEIVKTYEFSTGEYGYDPIFFIEDPEYIFNGKLITFYVNGVEAGQYIFENGGTTKFDLNASGYEGFCGDGIKDILYEECDDGNSINGDGCSVSCTSEEEDKDKNGGGRKRSFKPPQFCDVNWECSGWSECFNGITTRKCQETNHCEIPYNKPIEQTGCEITAKALIEKNGVNWAFILFGIIIPLILIIILIILLRKK